MTTTTVFSGTNDGRVFSGNGTYATARSGPASSVDTTSGAIRSVGQILEFAVYDLYEAFFSFDTSPITDSDIITAVVLSIYGSTDATTTDFVIEARSNNWGATVTTADWVAGASLGGLTRLATFNTSGWNASGYNDFTEDGTNFQAAIDKTGTTFVMLASDRMAAGTAPPDSELVSSFFADSAGTTNDPKLVVTSTVGVTTAYKDAATRLGLRVQAYKDAATRLGLRVQNYKDTATRLILRAQAYRDAATRLVLSGPAYRNAATRLLLSVRGYKDAGTRLGLRIQTYRDAATRLGLRVQAYKDTATRLRLSVTGYRDVGTRLTLRINTGNWWDPTWTNWWSFHWWPKTPQSASAATGYRDVGTRLVLVSADVGNWWDPAWTNWWSFHWWPKTPNGGSGTAPSTPSRRGWWWWGYTDDDRYR